MRYLDLISRELLLHGLREEFKTTADLIRGMDKIHADSVSMLAVKEIVLSAADYQTDDFAARALKVSAKGPCH